MTQYQKIATLIFRIIGILVIIASLISWIPAMVMSWASPPAATPFLFLGFLPHLAYLIVGMVLFTASRLLAKWVCFDFDKFND